MTRKNTRPASPYLEHVTGVEGVVIADCEACPRTDALTVATRVGEDDTIFVCIPTTGCRDDAWERKAHPDVFLEDDDEDEDEYFVPVEVLSFDRYAVAS